MIEKLETKDLEKDLAGMITVLGNKLNEQIEASNEQEKKIDFIIGNVSNNLIEQDCVDGQITHNKTLKELYRERCPNCSKQLVDYSYHKQCNNCDYKFIKE